MLSDQGTAASETALCEECYSDENREYASNMRSPILNDIPEPTAFRDCSGNDALYCCVCGRGADGAPAPDGD
ncbi:MAG: hypothetical protein ABSG53_32480 [Thermoguttaceae bacterium]